MPKPLCQTQLVSQTKSSYLFDGGQFFCKDMAKNGVSDTQNTTMEYGKGAICQIKDVGQKGGQPQCHSAPLTCTFLYAV